MVALLLRHAGERIALAAAAKHLRRGGREEDEKGGGEAWHWTAVARGRVLFNYASELIGKIELACDLATCPIAYNNNSQRTRVVWQGGPRSGLRLPCLGVSYATILLEARSSTPR